jgi:hemoglobin
VTGDPPAVSVFDAVGGQRFFDDLVRRFYARVADDPVLRPLYPESDEAFDASARWLALFLGQYWGGPTGYSESRGHPRLRMRHAPFTIGPAERDAWLHQMRRALDTLALPPEQDGKLWDYLTHAAEFMVNSPGAS